jgi:hypothetical protein
MRINEEENEYGTQRKAKFKVENGAKRKSRPNSEPKIIVNK